MVINWVVSRESSNGKNAIVINSIVYFVNVEKYDEWVNDWVG